MPVRPGSPGRGQLYINNELVGNEESHVTVPITFGIEGVSRGYDFGETVSHEYHGALSFTGKIHTVTVDVSGDLIVNDEAAMRRLMASNSETGC